MAVDVARLFPKTYSGNRYVLVAMDYSRRRPKVYAIPKQEAATVAGVLVNKVPREL